MSILTFKQTLIALVKIVLEHLRVYVFAFNMIKDYE